MGFYMMGGLCPPNEGVPLPPGDAGVSALFIMNQGTPFGWQGQLRLPRFQGPRNLLQPQPPAAIQVSRGREQNLLSKELQGRLFTGIILSVLTMKQRPRDAG